MGQPSQEDVNQDQDQQGRQLTLRLDNFAWRAISEESSRLGISLEELARFSLLYYIADLNSGRVARSFPGEFALHSA